MRRLAALLFVIALAVLFVIALAVLFGPVAASAQQTGSFYTSTPALASNLVVATGAQRKLMTFEVAADSTLSAAAWWILVFDATVAPDDGAVTPVKCYAAASGQAQLGGTFATDGPRFQSGVVFVVSTTGCFTQTKSVHAFISADVQ